MSADRPMERAGPLRRILGSLRGRLFAFLLLLAVLVTLAVAGATYASVRREADALLDDQLRQMALSLRDQGRIDEGDRAALDNPSLDFVVQIWSMNGVALYSSHGTHSALPRRVVLGFSEAEVDGEPWRIYAAATPLRVVQVGQPLAVRHRQAARAAARSSWPVLAAAPLVALGLWSLLGLSLAPLRRVVHEAQRRAPGSLAPLPTAQLPSELQPRVHSFNGLLGRLDAAFAAQRDFVADAAHELRTPLTALKLQIGLLAAGDEDVQRLRAGVDRASHLVEQLLALARAEPGAGAPLQAVDLVPLLQQAVADASALAQARGVRLVLHPLPAEAPLPAGDPQALRGLLRNLLDNAIKYGGGRVELGLQASAQDGLCLQVDDDGPGIPPEDRERVFARFHRRGLHGGDEQGGSGLGLAIVRAVAQQHGAQVRLADAPLGGLRVTLHFPHVGLTQR